MPWRRARRLAGLPATVIQENFRNTAAVLDGAGVTGLNGALLDLACPAISWTKRRGVFPIREMRRWICA